MRSSSLVAAILLTVNNFCPTGSLCAETVEEVLAVVGDTPVLLSDIALCELVNLVPTETGEDAATHHRRLLDARTRLELQYRDLVASGALYRLEIDTGPTLLALAGRIADDSRGVDHRLAASGLDRADLEDLALRLAAADAFVEQRLRPRIQIGLADIEAAYRSLVLEPLSAAGEPVPELSAARDQLHQLLLERRLNDEIERWLTQAAERHDVTRFAP